MSHPDGIAELPTQPIRRSEVEPRPETPFNFYVVGAAKEGPNATGVSEDMSFTTKKSAGVLDGIGGHVGGEIASGEGKTVLEETSDSVTNAATIEEAVVNARKAFEKANAKVREIPLPDDKPTALKPGSTAVALYFWDGPEGERKAILAHVGDSRALEYIRGEGDQASTLTQLTLDDNYATYDVARSGGTQVDALIKQQEISNMTDPIKQLPKEERVYFTKRSLITKSLGQKPDIDPTIQVLDVPPGAVYLLMTDGLIDNLPDEVIKKILDQYPDLNQAMPELLRQAQEVAGTSLLEDDDPRRNPLAKFDDMEAVAIEQTDREVPQKEEQPTVKLDVPQQEATAPVRKFFVPGATVIVGTISTTGESVNGRVLGYNEATERYTIERSGGGSHEMSKAELELLNVGTK